MRIANSSHQALSWRIREIAPDFTLEDVWALPVKGAAGDFGALMEVMASLDPTATPSAATRALFELRLVLGRVFGWDDTTRHLPIPGSTDTSLKARLPEDLRNTSRNLTLGSPNLEGLGVHFAPVYATDRESAAEISNQTMHGILHLGWVEQGRGRFRGQLAVYVKPRGAIGRAYMALIRPFRHLVVYPALMRQVERAWRARRK